MNSPHADRRMPGHVRSRPVQPPVHPSAERTRREADYQGCRPERPISFPLSTGQLKTVGPDVEPRTRAGAEPQLGFRSVLRNRHYPLGRASSNSASVGYSVYAISIIGLTYTVTHSYLIIGVVLFAEFATYSATFLVAPFADRVVNQRTIYPVCHPVQAAAPTLGVAASSPTRLA